MKDQPTICFVAPEAYPILAQHTTFKIVGGAEVQQCIIAKALNVAGYNVSMVCLDYGQPDHLNIDGIRVFKAHKPNDGIPLLRFIHPRATSLWRAMKRANADIYYQRTASFHTGLVSFFCKQNGKKMLFSAASDSDFIPGQQLVKYKRDVLLYEWGLKHANAIVTQSPRQQKLCKKNYNRESVYIRSCYEPYSCNECDDKRIDVLWVGTIKPLKQPELFIKLAQRLPEFRFRMAGGPPNANNHDAYYCKIKEQAAIVPNLEFMGFIPFAEIRKHFDETRLLVNTSEFEGFPNTFLQAWVRGIPAISFIDPRVSFEGQEVSITVSSIDELESKINELLNSPVQYASIGSTCKQYTEKFHSPEKIAYDYSGVFTSLTG